MQLGPVEGGEGGEAAVHGHVLRGHQVRAVAVVQVCLQELLCRRFVLPIQKLWDGKKVPFCKTELDRIRTWGLFCSF